LGTIIEIEAIYVLKLSLRGLFGKLNVVAKYGLNRSVTDHSIFMWRMSIGTIVLVVYIDDIVD